jgi:penicillin G amidase
LKTFASKNFFHDQQNPPCAEFDWATLFFSQLHFLMKILRFVLVLALTGALVGLLSRQQTVGEQTLPAIGHFFNPFSGFWRNAEPVSGPSLPAEVRLPGLRGKVSVAYDDLLVPHIFAENDEDAAMVQGYVTAQHRLFQMNLTARRVAGRLSEVLGTRTLELDKTTRRRGLPWAAERDLEAWKKSKEGVAMLEAYAAGVNAYVAQLRPEDLPIEFKLIGFQPDTWTTLHCAYVVTAMADMLATYDRDGGATNALALLGRDTYDQLYPHWNPRQQPVVPSGLAQPAADTGRVTPTPAAPLGHLSTPRDETDPPKNGSNNWAVAGSKTASGHPMLANDPHLGLTLPSIWFQVQVHTPTTNCYGVSLPGLPGIVIGYNQHMAWGITNVGVDVSDWYRIKWTDATKSAYLIDNQPIKTETRVEEIFVKNRPAPLRDTVRYTSWGPVVHTDPKHPYFDCAYRWVGHEPAIRSVLGQFLLLNKGKGFADYQRALVDFDCPGQNFVFADRTGDIAIRVQGRFPIRKGEEGRFVRDGSTSSEAWSGWVPQENLLTLHNPKRGFVSSANQHSTDPNSPVYHRYGDWEQYRGRRIHDRLAAMSGLTIDSMKALQNDNFSIRASEALPLLLRLLDRNGLDAVAQGYVAELEKWDYRYEPNLVAPTLFEMWYDSTYYGTWDEMDALRRQDIPILFPESWRLIELLERDTNNLFFDQKNTAARESARQVVTQAFGLMTRQAATEALGGTLVYSKFKRFTINHLARIPAFGRTDVQVGGHRSALNAILRDHGPSWRMIVDLGDQVRGIGVYPGGQSGNPGSRYYDNLVDKWAAGEYYDLLLLGSLDEAQQSGRLLTTQTFVSQ